MSSCFGLGIQGARLLEQLDGEIGLTRGDELVGTLDVGLDHGAPRSRDRCAAWSTRLPICCFCHRCEHLVVATAGLGIGQQLVGLPGAIDDGGEVRPLIDEMGLVHPFGRVALADHREGLLDLIRFRLPA